MKIAILVAFIGGVCIGYLSAVLNQPLKPKYKLDPPEEWKAMSTDSFHPDTVTTWLDRDTVKMNYMYAHYIRLVNVESYLPQHSRHFLYQGKYFKKDRTDTFFFRDFLHSQVDSLIDQ